MPHKLNMKYLIGIDIGTQGTKVVLFSETGKNVSEAFVSSNLIYLEDGGIEQNPDEIYYSVTHGIKQVIQDAAILPDNVAAIGVSGQMAGIMAIDQSFNPVGNYDSWLDTRCAAYVDEMKRFGEDQIVQITGAPVSFYHGPRIIRRKKERSAEYAKIAKFILLTTYVIGKLCSLKADEAYIDYTYLHYSGFADIKKKCWSKELLEFFGIDASKMPRIVAPFDLVGAVSAQGSHDSGLSEGTKIIAGCGDTAATILGAGGYREGVAVDSAGTASVLALCTERYVPDYKTKTLICAHSVIEGLWTPLAYVAGGGQCISWFRNQIVNNKEIDYRVLDKEAESVSPGSEGLLFVPHFSGRTCPYNANTCGAWMKLKWNHHRGHLYRSIMESIAYEYRLYAEILARELPDFSLNTVFGVGGGAKSAVFNKIKADVLGCTYVPMKRTDSAVLATAVMSGFAVGIYDNIANTIDRFVQRGQEFQVDASAYASITASKAYYAVLEQMTG